MIQLHKIENEQQTKSKFIYINPYFEVKKWK